MSVILIYLHLSVVLSVGVLFCNIENAWAKAFGVFNAVFAIIYAYGYAIYSLWQVFRG